MLSFQVVRNQTQTKRESVKRICVYGGHYGSEGKGGAAEFIIRNWLPGGEPVAVFGEPGPNSGHTCSRGKVSNLPASSFFADYVVLGPDSAVSLAQLDLDLSEVRKSNPRLVVYIHENAALVLDAHRHYEQFMLVDSISSTGSGNGAARMDKNFHRLQSAVIGCLTEEGRQHLPFGVHILNRFQYLAKLAELEKHHWMFECSQGALLDNSWGIYPYVTSRCTLPRVAIERNGLGGNSWEYVGVYRTYPIRTGGPSGPTGEREIQFEDLGVEPEIATVTKRKRRIFKFSPDDFALSLMLTRPDIIMFTHGDYLIETYRQVGVQLAADSFYDWITEETHSLGSRPTYVSFEPGKFVQVKSPFKSVIA